jgi:hypothetical protein
MFVGHHHAYMGPRIEVIVTNTETVSVKDGVRAFGAFIAPAVLVAGRGWEDYVETRKQQVKAVGDTFIHELLHLERWIQGKPQTERGIEAKVKRIRKANKWL